MSIIEYIIAVAWVALVYGWIISEICKIYFVREGIEEVKETINLAKAYHAARNEYLDYTPSYREFLEERGV